MYFLIENKEIVYVGSSIVNILERVDYHFTRFVFDSYFCIEMKSDNPGRIRKLEELYIKTLNPKYNNHKVYTNSSFKKELKKLLFSYNHRVLHLVCNIMKKEKTKSIFKNKNFTGISDIIISVGNIEKMWPEIKTGGNKYSYEVCKDVLSYIQRTINKAIYQLKSGEEIIK